MKISLHSYKTALLLVLPSLLSIEGTSTQEGCLISTCPLTLIRGACSCHNVCTDPIGQTYCYTECTETCVPEGCLVTETNTYISVRK
ncbi:hypothetical protein HOLleu_24279 [Holothuria leucospilota]|uniref:Uncharacterized protein n=1 Tax=Holothuria leucospilota TaxID=206669 RepID=A0A9Q1H5D2_HOLLE|nr:hypothetical protein HOLleu_24279 [Holothuria leucospilota]